MHHSVNDLQYYFHNLHHNSYQIIKTRIFCNAIQYENCHFYESLTIFIITFTFQLLLPFFDAVWRCLSVCLEGMPYPWLRYSSLYFYKVFICQANFSNAKILIAPVLEIPPLSEHLLVFRMLSPDETTYQSISNWNYIFFTWNQLLGEL